MWASTAAEVASIQARPASASLTPAREAPGGRLGDVGPAPGGTPLAEFGDNLGNDCWRGDLLDVQLGRHPAERSGERRLGGESGVVRFHPPTVVERRGVVGVGGLVGAGLVGGQLVLLGSFVVRQRPLHVVPGPTPAFGATGEDRDNLTDRPPPGDRPATVLLLSIPQAAKTLGIGRSKIYELIADGELETVHIGRAVRIPVEVVEAVVRRLRQKPSERAGAVG